MASGTILMPEPYKSLYPIGLDGTSDDAPSASQDMTANNTNRYDQSHNPSTDSSPSHTSPPPHRDEPMPDSDLSSHHDDEDEDAAGEVDDDYQEMNIDQPEDEEDEYASSQSSDSRKRKRKTTVNDGAVDNIKKLQELYGNRRSGRARQPRYVVKSSEEDDDDEDEVVRAAGRKRQQRAPPSYTEQSSAEEDDNDSEDGYGGARARRPAKKGRGRLRNGGSSTPLTDTIRFSNRRTAKITSYEEDEEEGDIAEDDVAAWTYEDEDNRPRIDQILDHRRADGQEIKAEEAQVIQDLDYYVKWQHDNHYNAQWQTYAELVDLGGKQKLARYFHKWLGQPWAARQEPDWTVDEYERFCLEREAFTESNKNATIVERVINERVNADNEAEYLVKWRSLAYDVCTWEAEKFVNDLNPTAIERYHFRQDSAPRVDQRQANLRTRGAFTRFDRQPDYITGGKLRDFQLTGINFIAAKWSQGENTILADEMGLGKTVQTISFLSWLIKERGIEGPHLVVAPLSTIAAWAETFDTWTPDINYVVYNGRDASRAMIREHEMFINGNPRRPKFNVLLTTYEFAITDADVLGRIPWQFMAVDEAHRLKNASAVLYQRLSAFKVPACLLLTGTPMQNNLAELAALMNFLKPGTVDVSRQTKNKDVSEHDIKLMADTIKPYILRRIKENVVTDIPPKTEKIIRVELSDVQLEYYKHIMTRNTGALEELLGVKVSLMNTMMELRKISNHAFMFANLEAKLTEGHTKQEYLRTLISSSGKLMLLDQLLAKLKQEGRRVLVFSQLVTTLDILGICLEMRGYQYQRLDGTMQAANRKHAIDHFNAEDSQDFCFILSTRAGGLGINLTTADVVIIFDSDWNPQADIQAMARAHRIGQTKAVNVFRLVSKDTVEEDILEVARNKRMLEFVTMQRGLASNDDSLKRANASLAEPTSASDISRILKKRGQKMFEQSDNQKKLEAIDINTVVDDAEELKIQTASLLADSGEEFLKSFEYTDVKVELEWEDVLPQADVERIRKNEQEQKSKELVAALEEESRPRKRRAPEQYSDFSRAAKRRNVAKTAPDSDDDDDEEEDDPSLDPTRPLNEKETRNLIRAFERYGSIEDKQTEILKEARLTNRNPDTVKDTLKQILDQAESLLENEQQRLHDLEVANGRPITKKDRRTILFDYNGVKRLNAETLLERPKDLHALRGLIAEKDDELEFRLPEASKQASYTCAWGDREDGMLLVGIARHGYGAWTVIRDDPDLALKDKFFLEEHRVANAQERDKAEDKAAKSPGAVHLVRRTLYLFDCIRLKTSAGTDAKARRAMDNHHRNNRKGLSGSGAGRLSTPAGGSASPANGAARKTASNVEAKNGVSHAKVNKDHLQRRISPGGKAAQRKIKASSEQIESALEEKAADAKDARMLAVFKPWSEALDKLKHASSKHMPDAKERSAALSAGLAAIGDAITRELERNSKLSEDNLWDFAVKTYWLQPKNPKLQVTGAKLKTAYIKRNSKAAATEATAENDTKGEVEATANGIAGSKVVNEDETTKTAKDELKEADNKEEGKIAKPDDLKQETVVKLKPAPTFGGLSSADLKSLGPIKRRSSEEKAGGHSGSNTSEPDTHYNEHRRTVSTDRRPRSRSRSRSRSPIREGRRTVSRERYQEQRSRFGDERRSNSPARQYGAHAPSPRGRPPQYKDNGRNVNGHAKQKGGDHYRPDYGNAYRPEDRKDDRRRDYYTPRPHSPERKPAFERGPERHPLPKKPEFAAMSSNGEIRKENVPNGSHQLPDKAAYHPY